MAFLHHASANDVKIDYLHIAVSRGSYVSDLVQQVADAAASAMQRMRPPCLDDRLELQVRNSVAPIGIQTPKFLSFGRPPLIKVICLIVHQN